MGNKKEMMSNFYYQSSGCRSKVKTGGRNRKGKASEICLLKDVYLEDSEGLHKIKTETANRSLPRLLL